MNKVKFLSTIILISFMFACEKDDISTNYTHLMFPIGRAYLFENNVSLQINGLDTEPDIIEDGFGGFWIKIPVDELSKPSEIKVRYLRKNQKLALFDRNQTDIEQYLQPAKFIDSDNQTLILKAKELCTGLATNNEKADKIARFVGSYLKYSEYKNSFLENASNTYNLAYGTCMNHSRLTITLCRAADVPARSVWGVISGQNGSTIYDYHHQWTEILGDDGFWHPLDNTHNYVFDLNDIHYLDLYYAAEQNTFMTNNPNYKFLLGDVKYFDGYPAPLSGRLNCINVIEDKSPDSILLEYKYLW